MSCTRFLDLDFDTLTAGEAEHWLAGRKTDSLFAYLVTPNVDHMVRLAKATPDVQRAYADADLCLCDSRVLASLAKFADSKLTVVPGSDLVATLFTSILRDNDKVCVIGGAPEAAAQLQVKFPQFSIMHHSPPMGLRHDKVARTAAVEFAVSANARFILLAVGSPQQEILAWEIQTLGRCNGTALCIGASIDFLIGTQSRAPHFMRRAGCEWVWRLLTQPRRLARRYLVDGPAIFPMAWRWRQAQRARRA